MKKKPKKRLMNLFIFILFMTALFLGYKINERKQFVALPPISSWLPYENWFQFYDHTVSNQIQYHHLVDNIYTNGTNTCSSIFDGIILEVSDSSVTILHDNGVQVIYGELNDILVQVDERILKGSNIGSINDSVTLEMTLNNQIISYEEVMKL